MYGETHIVAISLTPPLSRHHPLLQVSDHDLIDQHRKITRIKSKTKRQYKLEQQIQQMIDPNARPPVPTQSSTFEWSQSQDLDGTIARTKARFRRPETPSSTISQSRSRYLVNRKPKTAPGPPSTNGEITHDTKDDASEKDDNLVVYVEGCSPALDADDGSEQRPESSHEVQMRQIRKLRQFFGTEGGIPLERKSQDREAMEVPIDWILFYSQQNESMPRDNFLATPSMEWGTLSDDCPVTSNTTKPVPRDRYLATPSTEWGVYSDGCPITSSISANPAPIELSTDSPVSLKSAKPRYSSSAETGEIIDLAELPGDFPIEIPPVLLWSKHERRSSKVKGYVSNLRHRCLVEFKAGKDPVNTPNFFLNCPKEIVLTQPSRPQTAITEEPESASQEMLAVPPRLYKKKERQQQIMNGLTRSRELTVRRSSQLEVDHESFAASKGYILAPYLAQE